MTKFLLALLTTLFVSAMPLQAAYALADAGNKVENTDKQACTSPELYFPQDLQDKVKELGGVVQVITDEAEIKSWIDVGTRVYGGPPPHEFNKMLIIHPTDEASVVLLAYFNDNCLVMQGKIPYEKFQELFEEAFGRKA